jgi:hypothetical protein
LLIRYNLTARVWRPLIEITRRRHVRFRRRLAQAAEPVAHVPPGTLVTAGV